MPPVHVREKKSVATPERLLEGEHEVWLADSLDPEHVARVMGDRKADLLCVDAPYSEKTHSGHDLLAQSIRDANGDAARDLSYASFDECAIRAFVALWEPRTSGWFVTITDHVLAPLWVSALGASGRLVFYPLPLVELGGRFRMVGDGPSCWTCQVIVARPRGAPFNTWGVLPGAYVESAQREKGRVVGGKPFRSMCAIVGDYSRPGDLVVDPCCGGGTTLSAARYTGRKALGIDQKREHAEMSVLALQKARHQTVMF